MNLLKYLITNVHKEKIMFVVTAEFRPRLIEDAVAIEVMPLKKEEQDFLVRQFTSDTIDVSSGLPIHVYQYLRLFEETNTLNFFKAFCGESIPPAGPLPFSDLAWIIERRIGILDDKEQEFLQQVALTGMNVNTELLENLFPKYDFYPTLEIAVERGFLDRLFGRYRFNHRQLHRRLCDLYKDKKSMHLKIAQTCGKLKRYEELIAFHLIQAGETDKAIEALRACAKAVKKRNALANAVEYVNQALELLRRKIDEKKEPVDVNAAITLYEEMGDLYREMGDEEKALRYYKLVLDGFKEILK